MFTEKFSMNIQEACVESYIQLQKETTGFAKNNNRSRFTGSLTIFNNGCAVHTH